MTYCLDLPSLLDSKKTRSGDRDSVVELSWTFV